VSYFVYVCVACDLQRALLYPTRHAAAQHKNQPTADARRLIQVCAEPLKALPVAHPLDNADHEKFQGAHALGQLALPLLLLPSEVRLQAERLYHLLVRRRALHVNLVAQDQERDALWERRAGERESGREGNSKSESQCGPAQFLYRCSIEMTSENVCLELVAAEQLVQLGLRLRKSFPIIAVEQVDDGVARYEIVGPQIARNVVASQVVHPARLPHWQA